MKRLIKYGSVGLVIAGAIATGGQASAQTIPSVYRQFIPGKATLIGISGTPNTKRTLSFPSGGATKTSTVRVNACGFAKITNPSALTEGNINVGGISVNVAATKAGTAIIEPTCVGGISANLPATGSAFNVGKGAIVISSLPTSRVLDVTYVSNDPVIRNVTINACGFGTTSFTAGATVSVDGGTPIDANVQPYAGFSCSSGKLSAAVLSPFVTPQVPIPALAAISRDSLNNLIFKDPTSGISISGSTFSRSATSDRCGGLYLPASTSGVVSINGVSIDTDAFPSRTGQETCTSTNGLYGNSEGYYNSRWSDGRVYIKNFPGLALGDRSIVTVQSTGARPVTLSPNSCGIALVRSSATLSLTPTTSFTQDGVTPIQINSLPLISRIPSCSTLGLTIPVN
jgi:hypothetical protein